MATKLKTKISAGVIATALLAAIPFITDREGESLESYQDVVGVWTICNGETHGVKPGDRRTQDECRQLTQSRVGQFMTAVAQNLTVEVSSSTLAAHTSFAYNIGLSGYAGSKALKLTNAGDPKAGCLAMGNWYTAGGRDCRIRANNCYGLVQRRNDEIKLCLSGL